MFRTIMVHVDSLSGSVERTRFAVDLARQFDAKLIGLTAGVPRLPFEMRNAAVGTVSIGPDYSALDRKRIEAEFTKAATSFKEATQGSRLETEWRAIFDSPSAAVIHAATAVDLVILGAGDQSLIGDFSALSAGDVLFHTGRPILLVPPGRDRVEITTVVVAWKESPEAQRAIADAIPFMKRASNVVIVEVNERGGGPRSLVDPQAFLVGHGITAKTQVLPSGEGGIAAQVTAFANSSEADLIVAGGYGHSRLREWVFGGVTRELLARSPIPCLFSH
jgi:nucleotide-binding universal stress UspA family protein